ncbi:isopenicillin N synthase family oxygenase [Streptomyces malaysiensis]|uniref:hypothetical protein n=1 Tax=Streptomyces malaysiensis TaxID=92644 RepID=UPI0020C6E728|nr:hypothetical protein [Streptomyces samsunensis]
MAGDASGRRRGGEHEPGTEPDATAPDLHESFYLGPGIRTGNAVLDRLYYPANHWPEERAALRAAADAYTAHMVRLAGEINVPLATVLGLPEDYFTTRARQATWT